MLSIVKEDSKQDCTNYCRSGIRRSAGSFREFAVDENFEGDRAAERKGGGSGGEEAAGSGSTCSRPNRAIGAGLN